MGDLISRRTLIEAIVNSPTDTSGYNPVYCQGTVTRQHEIIDIINVMPTAYDMEKVVEQICGCDGCSGCCNCHEEQRMLECEEYKRIYDIVRNGGKE